MKLKKLSEMTELEKAQERRRGIKATAAHMVATCEDSALREAVESGESSLSCGSLVSAEYWFAVAIAIEEGP